MALRRIATHRVIRVLRAVLPIVVLVLIGILARNYWTRLRQTPPQEARAQQLPRDLAALMEGFTYSHTEGEKTLFTVRAKGVSESKDHRSIFRDVEVTVYGRQDGERTRRVSSEECSYDEQTKDIRFAKNVNAQLDENTFARTEELTYNHGNGRISSRMPTRFEQRGALTGAADRFEYETNSGLLRLTGNVRMEHGDGSVLQGGAAIFQSRENWAAVSQGVYLESPNGW